jgi:hypothetical protein
MSQPHYAQINFSIDIFPVMEDGSLGPNKLTISDLEGEGIAPRANFGISGFTKSDCISKLKQVLMSLKYEEV